MDSFDIHCAPSMDHSKRRRAPTIMNRALLLVSLVLSFSCCLLPSVSSMPMQVTVNQRSTECLYDKVDAGESLTMSVFVLSGSELRATAIMEGPIAPADVSTGKELQDAIDKFRRDDHYGKFTSVSEVVDFEHLQPEIFDDDDDDDDAWEDDDEEITEEKRKQRREARMKRAREAKARRERQRKERQKNIRSEGEPFQKTMKAQAPGWYRMCVRGTWYQIVVEMELRKASDLGGIDKDSGHVYTYEQRAVLDEEKMLAEDTASEEEGVQDEDFDKTRDQLRRLRKLLADIQSKQMNERHRLAVHAATNEHSHSRMVLTSLVETVLFMAVTGFQIFTIRKWFQGTPVLGR